MLDNNINDGALIIFAKYPDPKTVKTRLSPLLNESERVELYIKMLNGTIEKFGNLNGIDSFIFYTPMESGEYFEQFGLNTFPQAGLYQVAFRSRTRRLYSLVGWQGGNDADVLLCTLRSGRRSQRSYTIERNLVLDIGQRMYHAINLLNTIGYEKVSVIGTDIPDLEGQTIYEAFEQLELHDIVIGPAMDGGYYLIGMKAADIRVFTDISWSTGKVLSQTIKIIESLGLNHYLLKTYRDIDRPDDLKYCYF